MDLQPIGRVVSPATDAVDSEWGRVVSTIELRPEFADGLRGLESFSHAVVVFLMHEATFDPARHLTRHPQDRPDMPRLGIFAQRARHRPNPIGVTTVRVESVADGRVTVRGLDAIDGTPVLDLKPHVGLFDAPSDRVEPEWVSRVMAGYF